SKGYIRRVARVWADNGSGGRGDLAAVIKAILLDGEALNSQQYEKIRRPAALLVSTKGTEHCRLREPVLIYTAMFRAFRGQSDYVNGYYMIVNQETNMKQSPYGAPSVFNYYLPHYQPPGFDAYVPSSTIPNGEIYG